MLASKPACGDDSEMTFRRFIAALPLQLMLLVSLTGGLFTGCVSTKRFEALEMRVADLERERERLHAQMREDVNRLTNLHGMLTQAEETLRKSGVKLGIRMEQLEADVPKLKGEIEAVTFRLKQTVSALDTVRRELFDRIGATAVYLPRTLPSKAEETWKLYKARRDTDRRREAMALLVYFESTFTDDERADDALMAIGVMLEEDGDPKGAIQRYQAIHDRYRSGDQVSAALWRIATLFEQRQDCDRAKGVYRYLEKSFAETKEGQQATERLPKLKDLCKRG
jgi:TolA-binding protein